MSEPIRHHYIPQFYLREWAGQDGKVFRYQRKFQRVTVDKDFPKKIAYEPYLYTISTTTNSQILEKKFFSDIDNYAALVLQNLSPMGPNLVLLDRQHLNDTRRSDWARFIQSLHPRGPHSLTEINTVLHRILRENMERDHGAAYRATKKAGEPDSVYDYAISDAPQLFADAHKLHLTELINHEQLGDYLINMTWAVLDVSDARHPLLTCDRPYILPRGLKDPTCILAVPISPTRIFLAANNRTQLEALGSQASEDTVRNTNDLVVRMAVQQVYGSRGDRRQFVEKRLIKLDEKPLAGLIMGPG